MQFAQIKSNLRQIKTYQTHMHQQKMNDIPDNKKRCPRINVVKENMDSTEFR